jgi:hypothetical protein
MIDALKYFSPLIGVFVGWLLSQLSERNKSAREDKRKLKRTIFYLLEVRHHLSMYVIDEAQIAAYISLLKSRYEPFKNVEHGQLKVLLSSFLNKILFDKPLMSTQEIESLNSNYLRCIDNLSEIEPVMAFRLHGRQNIKQLLGEFNSRSQVSVVDLTSDIRDVEEVKEVFRKIEPNLIKEVIKDINEILMQLSRVVSETTLKEVREKISPRTSKAELAQMEKFLDGILKGLTG